MDGVGQIMNAQNVDTDKMYVDKSQSQAYVQYRPTYTDEMFQVIVDYCKKNSPTLGLAVDVGCGPGSSTLGFGKYFKKVIGIDVSPTQIEAAPQNVPNVEFKVGHSHQLPFIGTSTVDLFCSGEAFNLMPEKETFQEADRLLKPGGTIALFGYNNLTACDSEVDKVLKECIFKLLPYWPAKSAAVTEGYRNVVLPYSDFTRNDDLKIHLKTDVKHFVGFVKSLFPYVSYCKQHPDEDLAAEIDTKLTSAVKKLNGPKGGLLFESTWDIFILMGHKPKN